MRRFVLGWKVVGHEKRLDAQIVNYADDLVICCRGYGDQAMNAMRQILERLKLTVNETKTRQCCVPDELIRLPRLHHRSLLFAEDGTSLYWYASVEEEDPAALPRDQRHDKLPMASHRHPRLGREAQP